MAIHIPGEGIRCQRCDNIFFAYVEVNDLFDADLDNDIISGIVNRVECTDCDAEFTFETPIVIYSYIHKFIISTDCDVYPLPCRKFGLATQIAKSADWKFRTTSFTADAAEKIRIFKDKLCDGIIELLKIKHITEYKSLNLTEEYIVYENHDDTNIYFSKRDDCDNLLKTYTIPFRFYINETKIQKPIPTGDWIRVDREWAINKLEELL